MDKPNGFMIQPFNHFFPFYHMASQTLYTSEIYYEPNKQEKRNK